MKILKTNWINYLGVILAALVYEIVANTLNPNPTVSQTFVQSILAILFGIFFNGILFWLSFTVLLIALDWLMIIRNRNKLRLKLLIEWIIISLPFIYWSIIYERQRWLYLVAIAAFLITQLLRERLINKARN